MNRIHIDPGGDTLVPLADDADFPVAHPEYAAYLASRGAAVSNNARALAVAGELGLATKKFTDLMWDLGSLPLPFRALLRYKVSTRNTCLYCSTHQIKHLRKLGVTQEKIDNAHAFETHPAFDARERAALAFVDAMAEDATNIPDSVFARFKETFPPQERVEIAIIAGAMGLLNVLNDAFRLPIDKQDVDIAMSVPAFDKKPTG